MQTWGWIVQNVFAVLGAVGIIGGLLFDAFAVRAETKTLRAEIKTRQIANLLTVTASHREIWTEAQRNKKLARINDANVDTVKEPVTDVEMTFVAVVIQHMNSVYYVMNDQSVIHFEGFREDIAEFLALPIPQAVWEKAKRFQNADFVAFIESCLIGK